MKMKAIEIVKQSRDIMQLNSELWFELSDQPAEEWKKKCQDHWDMRYRSTYGGSHISIHEGSLGVINIDLYNPANGDNFRKILLERLVECCQVANSE